MDVNKMIPKARQVRRHDFIAEMIDGKTVYHVKHLPGAGTVDETTFDIIVMSDVLEHHDNVGAVLEKIKDKMSPGSKLIITVCNPFEFRLLFKLFFRYEAVHCEHTAYYSYMTLKRLLQMNGLLIEAMFFAYDEKGKNTGLVDTFLYHSSILLSKIFKPFSQEIIVVASLAPSFNDLQIGL